MVAYCNNHMTINYNKHLCHTELEILDQRERERESRKFSIKCSHTNVYYINKTAVFYQIVIVQRVIVWGKPFIIVLIVTV